MPLHSIHVYHNNASDYHDINDIYVYMKLIVLVIYNLVIEKSVKFQFFPGSKNVDIQGYYPCQFCRFVDKSQLHTTKAS